MLYKLAASKKKLQEDATKRADRHMVGSLIGAGTLTGPVPGMVLGYQDGKEVGHPVVGTLLGPIGVNGAVAKDTGVSTLGTSVGRHARNHALVGAGLLGGTGAITGGMLGGATHGIPGAIGGALAGGIAGGVTGGALGGLTGVSRGAITHGLGHVLGSDQSHRYKKKKRR